MRRLWISLVVLAVGSASGAPLAAVWSDAQLERREVELLSLGEARFRFVDADRNVEDAGLGGVVRLGFPGGGADPDPADGRVALTDGQSLAGRPADAASAAETLAWRHPALGVREIPLERIASVRMPGAMPAAGPPPASDELTLANGDVLTGFVAAVDAAGVTLEPDAGGPAAAFGWDAIAGFRLANPGSAPAAGTLLTLSDGSRLVVAAAGYDGEAWAVTPDAGGSAVRLPAGAVAALQPAASALRLLMLETLAVEEPAAAVAFGVAFPAYATEAGLNAHAPTRLRLGPAGPVRATRVRLRLTPEAAASPLASVDASLGEAEPTRLNAAAPSAELRSGPGEGPLELVLGEAEHGPVLDRVVVTEAEVLVEAASP